MRLNAKAYQLAEGYEPFETQEFDGRIVELYYLDDFDPLYNQNVTKGKFVVWTSMDGTNYRLFIEKGFYEHVKELYSQPINKIWLDFWDRCDDVTKKFNYRILVPLAVLCLACYLIIALLFGTANWSIYAELGVFLVFIIGMLFLNKFTKNKMNTFNKESVDLIKQTLTPEGFEDVLNRQREYIDTFFDKKQAEIDAEIAAEDAKDHGEDKYVDEDETEETTVEDKIEETAVTEEENKEKVEDNHE